MLGKIYSLQQKILTKKYNSSSPIGYVFMFHKIEQEPTGDNFSISIDNFCYFVNYLKNKIGILPLEQIANGKRGACITFDDGYKNVLTNAVPFLEDNNIDFTLFITLGFLGKDNYLKKDDISKLSNLSICTIGAHSMSHPMLRFSKNQKYEINNSKILLEQLIKKEVFAFAYPYGSINACNKACVKIVKSCGYSYAFSTIRSGVSARSMENRFFLPRINVNDNNFNDIICGLEDWRRK